MTRAYSVAQMRRAEEATGELLTNGSLMQRAAFATSVACVELLDTDRVPGSRVVLLVGSGGNGGDALWAGAFLAHRGCRVDACLLAENAHATGLAALRRAGGRIHEGVDANLLFEADLILDGIAGIGGSGPLRDASLATLLRAVGATIVAVDVPSGVDADTGEADPMLAVPADTTVTFGALKPGLVIGPGRDFSGQIRIIDIGLEFDEEPVAEVIEALQLAMCLPQPAPDDYKYSRGVVGIVAGSEQFRGAALLCTGAAARANLGMVVYLDRGDGLAADVVRAVPDIVAYGGDPRANTRVNTWVIGPGIGDDAGALLAVLDTDLPVVLDADALRMVTQPQVQAALSARADRGQITVMTPHVGEFAALGFELGSDRLASAKRAAEALRVIMVLKGAGTIMAAPSGRAYLDVEGTEVLGTAGSGDVLAGLVGSFLAANQPESVDEALTVVAAAVAVHGIAGSCAEAARGSVNSVQIMHAIPDAYESVLG